MDVQVATLLALIESKLSKNVAVCSKHAEASVIEQFDGLDVMVYLCLSNPKCTDYLDENKLNRLNQLFESNDILPNDDIHNHNKQTPIAPSIDTNIYKTQPSSSMHGASLHSNSASITPIATDADYNTQQNSSAVFTNLMQFYTHSMTLVADPYANIYHKIFKLSLTHTKFIFDKILFSKWFFHMKCMVI